MIENRGLSAQADRVRTRLSGCLWMVLVTLSMWVGVSGEVVFFRVPDGGIQPQAVVSPDQTIHLIYFQGDPFGGDLYYTTRALEDTSWAESIQVNSIAGSVVVAGTVRGGHLALGRGERVHVAWMSADGGGEDGERAMYYTRSTGDGRAFEPQRNVITHAYGLDGGGSVSADQEGNVSVVWHAGEGEEQDRRVYVAVSDDDGKTFAEEVAVSDADAGACGCCGIRSGSASGVGYVLYRTAREEVHRDANLIVYGPRAPVQINLQSWELGACPMSTASLLPDSAGALAAWETDGQVFFGRYTPTGSTRLGPVSAPGDGGARKHPVLARNKRGDVLMAWTDGTGWKRGGSFGWQVYDANGRPVDKLGARDGVPVWSMVAAVSIGDGFAIIH